MGWTCPFSLPSTRINGTSAGGVLCPRHLTGIGCFLSRIGPNQLKWTHRWFGRGYILSMVWCMATSLSIHNSGLPLAVLWSFIWVLLFMSLGWVIIVLHINKVEKLATKKVEDEVAKGGSAVDLHLQILRAKGAIANAKTFKERIFPYKALHGIVMFTSWINITGRILASNQSGDFTCHTYTVYKPLDTPHGNFAQSPITLMPSDDPMYKRTPWARIGGEANWAVALCFGPFLRSLVVGLIYTAFVTRNQKTQAHTSSERSSDDGLFKSLIAEGKRTLGLFDSGSSQQSLVNAKAEGL